MHMKKRTTLAAATLAATAAMLFSAGASAAPEIGTELGGPLKVKCFGANACKGQGACASTSNACKGHNACKGQGFEFLGRGSCVDRLGRA
jgi:uncharacterized membrane protein